MGKGPQLENGYTRLANEILENIARYRFNGTQRSIIDVIWRYTYGFGRSDHDLSLTFISNATGLAKSHVKAELDSLVERKVIQITAESGGSKSRQLSFNKNYEEWIRKEPVKKSTIKAAKTVIPKQQELFEPPTKVQFADKVFLLQSEYDRLVEEFGKSLIDYYISSLDEWFENNPAQFKKKKDHNKTIRKWIKKDEANKQNKPSQQKPLTPRQKKNQDQMEILRELHEEGKREREQGTDRTIDGSGKNSLPEL